MVIIGEGQNARRLGEWVTEVTGLEIPATAEEAVANGWSELTEDRDRDTYRQFSTLGKWLDNEVGIEDLLVFFPVAGADFPYTLYVYTEDYGALYHLWVAHPDVAIVATTG